MENNTHKVRFHIDGYEDRLKVAGMLALYGYSVKVIPVTDDLYHTEYFVEVEVETSIEDDAKNLSAELESLKCENKKLKDERENAQRDSRRLQTALDMKSEALDKMSSELRSKMVQIRNLTRQLKAIKTLANASETKTPMHVFDFSKGFPYTALIMAGSKEQALTIYEDVVCDLDDHHRGLFPVELSEKDAVLFLLQKFKDASVAGIMELLADNTTWVISGDSSLF